MRLVALGLTLALASALSGPAQAAAQPLARGEVVVQLGAIGTTEAPADVAVFTVEVMGQGTTQAAAQADLRARAQRVARAASQAGGGAVIVGPMESTAPLAMFDVREEPPPVEEPVAGPAPPELINPLAEGASGSFTLRLTDISRFNAVRAAIAAAEPARAGYDRPYYQMSISGPTFELSNDGAARAVARTQALAAVRAEAEAYAASLGMRIVRMDRVSERTGVELLPLLIGSEPQLARRAFGRAQQDRVILVVVALGADFVLAPR